MLYRLKKTDIITKKRASDYIAKLEDDRIWEAGKTEEEAIGKLIITLFNATPYKGNKC